MSTKFQKEETKHNRGTGHGGILDTTHSRGTGHEGIIRSYKAHLRETFETLFPEFFETVFSRFMILKNCPLCP